MKFKKDGKVYESTEAMLKANCDTTCMTECEIRTRCRKWESCADYASVHPEEVAHYLGFEVLEDDGPTIGMISAKHSEDGKRDIRERKDGGRTMDEYIKRAHWIEQDGMQICSNCGEEHTWDDFRAAYCDCCGAKMDGSADNG